MEYKASLDTLCKVLTASIFVLLIFEGISSFLWFSASETNSTIGFIHVWIIHAWILFFIIAVIVVGYLYSTNKYTVTNDELIIHRPIKDRVIKIADITDVRIPEKAEFFGTIRTFGNGGLFGYYGKYYNSKLGSMTWYVTQRKNRILLQMKKGTKIIISPDDISLANRLKEEFQSKQTVKEN